MTHATRRSLYGRTDANLPSRFLDELPEEGVERERLRAGVVVGLRRAAVEPSSRRRLDVPVALDRRLRAPPHARHGDRHADRARRRRHGALRGRRRAAADARVRAAGEGERMSVDVRPCADDAEFERALMQIGQYFGWRRREAWAGGSSASLPRRADARGVGRRRRSSAARARCRSGCRCRAGRLPCCGHDGRRRRADAPPARRAARDDARPPRRRARARRADRGALGLGGGDLRPLRLRPRGVRGRDRAAARARAVRRAGRAARAGCGSSSRTRRSRRSRRCGTTLARRRPGMILRSREWWEDRALADPADRRGGAGPKRFALLEQDGAPAGYAIYRHTIRASKTGSSTSKLVVVEAIGAEPEAVAAVWRFLLDIDWIGDDHRVARCRPTIRCSSCSRQPRRIRSTGWATACGCASSTSARRSRAGRTRRTASSCSTCATSSARGTRGAGVSPAAPPSRPTPRRIWRSTSRRSEPRTSAA